MSHMLIILVSEVGVSSSILLVNKVVINSMIDFQVHGEVLLKVDWLEKGADQQEQENIQ